MDGIERLPIPPVLDATIRHLENVPNDLSIKDEIASLTDRAHRGESGATRQRDVYEETGSLKDIARDIAERTVP